MLELQGKYATAKVFTDVVDEASISQVISLLNQPYAEGERVRMMPDIHAGAGMHHWNNDDHQGQDLSEPRRR